MSIGNSFNGISRVIIRRPIKAALENMKRERKHVVVNGTSENGKQTHQQHHISTAEKHAEDLRSFVREHR